MEKNFIHFLHVLEHVDHFQAINVFSSGKPRKYIGWGYPPPPPQLRGLVNFRFFPRLFPRGGGHNWEIFFIHFIPVSEHIDHF